MPWEGSKEGIWDPERTSEPSQDSPAPPEVGWEKSAGPTGGVFRILPRDDAPGQQEGNQLFKIVRVVTVVVTAGEYLLEG